ncbi:hypothetical protein K0M31_004350 [Melipona bicolor]|uniref:Uncharacterized protein n=1 Tax=Melipona bicolor TaxID=60889 RepID=A0AA40KND6_9HYME|nr:hypothetical protein K0M31_004350 [Melipona bicolor]
MQGEESFAICEAKKRGQQKGKQRSHRACLSRILTDLSTPKSQRRGTSVHSKHDLPRVHSVTGMIENNDGQTSSESGRPEGKEIQWDEPRTKNRTRGAKYLTNSPPYRSQSALLDAPERLGNSTPAVAVPPRRLTLSNYSQSTSSLSNVSTLTVVACQVDEKKQEELSTNTIPATKSHRLRWRKSADESQQRRQQHVSSLKGSGRTFAAIGWSASRPARMSPGTASDMFFGLVGYMILQSKRN